MVPITVVTGHLLLPMHLSSQHLCKAEQCCYPHFTDGELKQREVLDSGTQLTVLNALSRRQLSHSPCSSALQEMQGSLAGNEGGL